jgi:Asp-tRNA(Asn)/Glu-tRNA(Gln) amidotransferase A subunit family amidase
MARTLIDCALLLRAMVGPDRRLADTALHVSLRDGLPDRTSAQPLAGSRLAVSPRTTAVELHADVAAGFERALETCRMLGALLVEPPAPSAGPDLSAGFRDFRDVGDDFLDVLATELLVYHRRFDGHRDRYRPSIREWVEEGERRAVSAETYVAAQLRRRELTGAWADWLVEHRVAAVIEPTIPVVAPPRGDGYEHWGTDFVLISLTHLWNWTGFPVVALPAGVGRSGLPVGVSLIGPAGADWELLALGIALQAELGVPEPPLLG